MRLTGLTRAGVTLNVLNRVYGCFFPILIETTQYQQWKLFVQDYLQQNNDGFFENENYKCLTIIIFFPF